MDVVGYPDCLLDLIKSSNQTKTKSTNQPSKKPTLFCDALFDLVDLKSGCQSPFHLKWDY